MDEEGEPVIDQSFLYLINASYEGVEYTLPASPTTAPWRQVLDTESIDNPFCEGKVSEKVIVGGRAIRVYVDEAQNKDKKKLAKTV
jgi:isoamylase